MDGQRVQCQVVGLDPGPGSTLRFSVEIQLEEWGFMESGQNVDWWKV